MTGSSSIILHCEGVHLKLTALMLFFVLQIDRITPRQVLENVQVLQICLKNISLLEDLFLHPSMCKANLTTQLFCVKCLQQLKSCHPKVKTFTHLSTLFGPKTFFAFSIAACAHNRSRFVCMAIALTSERKRISGNSVGRPPGVSRSTKRERIV